MFVAPAVGAVGADDAVAADGDVGSDEFAGDEVEEADVGDDEVGFGKAAPLGDAAGEGFGIGGGHGVFSGGQPAELRGFDAGREPGASGRRDPAGSCGRGCAFTYRCGPARRAERTAMKAADGFDFEALRALSGSDREASLARITAVAQLLDNAFLIPGLNRRIGLDAVIGLVPGIGDAVSAAISAYIVWEARRLGLPRWKIARMIGNVAVDTAIGIIPFAGDAFDMVFKANMRNLRIVEKHMKRGPREIDGVVVGKGRASSGREVVRSSVVVSRRS